MEIEWTLFARYAAPIITLLLGVALNRYLEGRPKLISFLAHASAVTVQPPNGAPFNVHTHSIVVRNAGRKPAVNVRLGHNVIHNFSVYPAVAYQVQSLPGGSTEIVFPTLVPGEQVTVSYLYYPPVVFSDVNSYAKSDEGFAKIVHVLPTPQPPPWRSALAAALMLLGATVLLYGAVEALRGLSKMWGGA